MNVIHKYVAMLQRLLEPSVRARDAGSYVRRRGNGYQFEGSTEEADIVAFRAAVQTAKAELVRGATNARSTATWKGLASGKVPQARV